MGCVTHSLNSRYQNTSTSWRCTAEVIMTTIVWWQFSKTPWFSRYQNVSTLDFIWAKDDGVGGDHGSSQIVTANKLTPSFYSSDAFPVAQPAVSKYWRQRLPHSTDLLTPSSPGVFQHCLWPLMAPSYLGKLTSLSSALWSPEVILHFW